MSVSKKQKVNSPSEETESVLLSERVLVIVLDSVNWDIDVLCRAASLSRRLHAVANRLLWRKLCVYRAPRMVASLTSGAPSSQIVGGWPALSKLLFYCCGCESTQNFPVSQPTRGHSVASSRFSKTSGRSLLTKKCGSDTLYLSDPCEHSMGDDDGSLDLGIFRGVFLGFAKSRTRACLVARGVELVESVRCCFCGARVWSMTGAGLVPRSAARRLGSHDGGLEFFVCVNGHMHGSCWLVPLTSDEGDINGNDDDGETYDDDDDDTETQSNGYFWRADICSGVKLLEDVVGESATYS